MDAPGPPTDDLGQAACLAFDVKSERKPVEVAEGCQCNFADCVLLDWPKHGIPKLAKCRHEKFCYSECDDKEDGNHDQCYRRDHLVAGFCHSSKLIHRPPVKEWCRHGDPLCSKQEAQRRHNPHLQIGAVFWPQVRQ